MTRRRRQPGPAVVAAAGLIVLPVCAALSGCGASVSALSYPTPPPSAPTETTAPPPSDLTGVNQGRVAGNPTTTAPALGPGSATIDGSVLGPAGPVPGATVQAERIVGSASAATQVTTGADGSFTIRGVLGGVYRMRAWQAPALALTAPQVLFVGASETKALSLQLASYAGVQVTTSMAPDPVQVGSGADLNVVVTTQTVGPDGVVRPQPQPGQTVTIDGGAGWTSVGADPLVTDSQGRAAFEFICQQPGAAPLVAAVTGATPATVKTSTCVSPPPATTTTTAPTFPGPPFGGGITVPTTPAFTFPTVTTP